MLKRFLVSLVVAVFLYITVNLNWTFINIRSSRTIIQRPPLILLYTNYFDGPPLSTYDAIEGLIRCRKTEGIFCEITGDKSQRNFADSVIFHSRDIKRASLNWTTIRPEGQIWVYMNQESFINTRKDLYLLNGIFNWTMTHRQDSNVPHPYGSIVPKKSEPISEEILKAVMSKKRKLAAWMVSNCKTDSKREEVVKKLQNFIPIDIYGGCGSLKCKNNTNCMQELATKYKFYLSFENSICKHYLTEKVFNPLKYFIVPIVYGGADYEKILPNNSFINLSKFETISEFVEHIKYLDGNDEEYLKYFKWKSSAVIENGDGWCSLCKMLYSKRNKLFKGQDIEQFEGGNGNVIKICNKMDNLLAFNREIHI